MSDLPEDTEFSIGGQTLTLAELANLDISEIREVRSTRLPPGAFVFLIAECDFDKREIAKEKNSSEKITVPIIKLVAEVEQVKVAMDTETKKPISDVEALTALIGKKHQETFFIRDQDGIGQFRAFMTDTGFSTQGVKKPLQELMNEQIGRRFIGMIKWKRNPDDPDVPYVNLNRDKLAPFA